MKPCAADLGAEDGASFDDDEERPEATYYDDDEINDDIDGDGPVSGAVSGRRGRGRVVEEGDEGGEGDDDSSGWETVSDDEEGESKKARKKAAAAAAKRAAAATAEAVAAADDAIGDDAFDSDDISDGAAFRKLSEMGGGIGLPVVGDTSSATQVNQGQPPPSPLNAALDELVDAFKAVSSGGGKPGGSGEEAVADGLHSGPVSETDGEEAFVSADEDEAVGGDATSPGPSGGADGTDAAATSARVAKAARAASAADRSAAEDQAACEAYAEHEQFWIVDDDTPAWTWHHYYEQGSSSSGGGAPAGPSAKIAQKQWKLLRAGLPAGIFVAATNERVDLMRAMITGPPGTPYQDAVFVFDLQLPPEFPQQPPSVHYLSHGQRINPNLYENGKVCLSLLGTWTGRQSCELWNPLTSNVLQVLISIQGLVLCEMPYFNEAGYDKQLGTSEGAHHARRYNEGALLLSCKAMMTSLKHLAPPLERLITLHFLSARQRILGRCNKLIELKDSPEAKAMLTPPDAAAGSSGAGGPGGGGAADGTPAAGSTSDASAPAEAPDGDGTADGKAKVSGPVAEAELAGVLNEMPSLGFLHSLNRQMPALQACLEGLVLAPAEGAEGEAPASAD